MGFRWNAFALDLRLEDTARGHHDWTERWREASIETKIKVSAQLFTRAYLKYNITGQVVLGVLFAALRQLGRTIFPLILRCTPAQPNDEHDQAQQPPSNPFCGSHLAPPH